MRKLRTCDSAHLNTGVSKCPPNFGYKKMAIIVPYGTKLPADLTADKLEELAHSDLSTRIYGVFNFVEYAKNGGEGQTSTNGYGSEQNTGYSALRETYTLEKFSPELHASFIRAGNRKWGVYFIDEDNFLFGENDGTDLLAPFPMSTIYTDVTPSPTSSAAATMSINFSYEDTKAAFANFDFMKLDFNPQKLTLGLIPVKLEKTGASGNAYKLYEKTGGYDITSIYGPLLVTSGTTVINGATSAVSYDADTDTLTIASSAGADVRLKAPSVLYDADIKGIEQVA